MSFVYDPKKMLRRTAPASKVARLATKKLTLNRTVVKTLADSSILSPKKLTSVSLEVIKAYKARYSDNLDDGDSKAVALEDATNDSAQLVQRVQNAVVKAVAKSIKSQYRGEFYTWLPSDAQVPSPIHQLNYGKNFQIGRGEMPGDREGCRCGMHVLVDDTQLQLED